MSDLNNETERLNDALDDAEAALIAARPGVTADVPLANGMRLFFGKEGNGWGLYVIDVGGGVCPLLKAGRRSRIAAAEALNPLLVALGEAREIERDAVRAAIHAAQTFATAVRDATPFDKEP